VRLQPWSLALAVFAWAAGCATAPRPAFDPGFAARAYTPGRIALLPPDVFVVLDQVGDNDPVKSAALGQAVSVETVRAVEQALRARGYDVDLSARWDGIVGSDGTLLVSRDELGALAGGIVAFANSPEAGAEGPANVPRLIAPELAARVGWATQSDALLYVNVKGAVTTPGKRAATVLAVVFIVVIVAAIIFLATQKGGGGSRPSGIGGGPRAQPLGRASAPSGGWHGAAAPARAVPARSTGWRGGGVAPAVPRGARVYRGGGGPGIGVAVIVPLDEPVYTHDGSVGYDEPVFAGDELYVSMTLVSTYDGRVLWHARDNLDLAADRPPDVDRMVHTFLDTLPPALPHPQSPAAPAVPDPSRSTAPP
jgi:hypothetical protein